MIHIEKDMENSVARKRLGTSTCKEDVRRSVANRKGDYYSSRYGHKDVRDELSGIYYDKCCYCEKKVKPVSAPHIEHYRPKAKITVVNEQGYYWLGNEWSNLLLACPSCNSSKSTKFPVWNNHRMLTHPINSAGDLDYAQLPLSSKYLNLERPLLINPEYHFPENLMEFNYFCLLVAKRDNILAVTTIEEIDLNNGDLVADRQSKADEIINDIEDQLILKHGDNTMTQDQFRNQLFIIFRKLIGRMSPESEYSLLGQNMVERFDEIILEDIDTVFHEEIRIFFIEFLENL
jgi:uncharacterized protein (TIGR02646 family)